jgi:triosephosphate isomerase
MASNPLWIGTSWKMNKTLAEARAYMATLVGASIPPGVQPFVLPPLTALAAMRAAVPARSPVLLGAQNAHWSPEGSWTGEVSMRMVRDSGAALVEIGHSERREHFGETDATVALKVRACLDAGLVPLLCVGESLKVREAGGQLEFVTAQVAAAMERVEADEVPRVLIAYEPVWAIGDMGRPAQTDEIGPVMHAVAHQLATKTGGLGARALLYGGSVTADNAADFLADPHTQGLFVGRFAWRPEGLLNLIAIGAAHLAGETCGAELGVSAPRSP